jgi:hypothetical protein
MSSYKNVGNKWIDNVEKLTLHINNSNTSFTQYSIFPRFTYSWFQPHIMSDVDRDGLEDIIYTTGDLDGINLEITWQKRISETEFSEPYTISDKWGEDGYRFFNDIDNDGNKDIIGISFLDPNRTGKSSIFWYRNETNSPVSTENNLQSLPTNARLSQNFPNPFNPTTNIEYDVSHPINIKIDVFNALGQKVTTLIDNQLHQIGEHSVTFDANNLSSGIYYYVLTANGFTETRKMTLIK